MKEIALHILDIVQNSIRANADEIVVAISENVQSDTMLVSIVDNGEGIPEELLGKVSEPFATTRKTRKVGMGLPLFKQSAQQSGGDLKIDSDSLGTSVEVRFGLSHIDRPILGDIAGVMTLLIGANPNIRFIYEHHTPLSDFVLDTDEVKQELEGVPVSDPDILKALKELISENLKLIEASIN